MGSSITKSFWLTFCALLLGLFVPLMVREYIEVRAEGIHDAEWHSASMAMLLQRDLSYLHPLYQIIDNLDDEGHFEELDQHVKNKIGYMGLLLFKVYDPEGKVIYSNDPSLIGKKYAENSLLNESLGSGLVSEIVSQREFKENYGSEANVDVVEVNMPISGDDGSDSRYILGFYFDYSPIQRRVNDLLVLKLGSLTFIFFVVTIILFVLFRKKQQLENKVEILESILPICQHCKKIRLETAGKADSWLTIESYFSSQSKVKFSHGICDDCMSEHYPELNNRRNI
jgi:hypothetical protein